MQGTDMIFGVCMSLRDHERQLQAKAAGAQYCEARFADFASINDADLKEFIDFIGSDGLPCPVSNGMFPKELSLVGPAVDYAKVDDFVERASERFASVGGKTVVFGSGGARRCPDDYSFERATEQLVEVCAEHIAPAMKKHGLLCVIEPLRREECNMVNSAKRGFEICKMVNKPEIQLLIDMYHFCSENEPLESILNYRGHIHHVHIASAKNNRNYPALNDGEDYQGFFDKLREIGYEDRRISLEGRSSDFAAQTKAAIDLMKKL